jgi:hypothetical protein
MGNEFANEAGADLVVLRTPQRLCLDDRRRRGQRAATVQATIAARIDRLSLARRESGVP